MCTSHRGSVMSCGILLCMIATCNTYSSTGLDHVKGNHTWPHILCALMITGDLEQTPHGPSHR